MYQRCTNKAKAFLGCLILLLLFSEAESQVRDPDIEAFENLFQENSTLPADQEQVRANQKLKFAVEKKDYQEKAKALRELGLFHLTRIHNYEQAMDFLIQALVIADSLELKREQIFTYLAIAQVFQEVGDDSRALQFLNSALQINQSANDLNILVLILNRMGKINAALGNLEEAFENYEQVLEHNKIVKDQKVASTALFNLGYLHQLNKDYKESLQQHKRALALRRSMHVRADEANSLNEIGELYRLMHNSERTLANHVAALEIRQALGDKRGIAESFNNIGVLYYDKKDYKRSVANLSLALNASQDADDKEQIRKSYEYLSLCFKALGDYKKALEYQEDFLLIIEFIQNEGSEQKLLETKNRYEINKKEALIDKLQLDRAQKEKEIEEQRKFKNFLYVLIALGVIIVLLVFYLYLLKKRSNTTLKEVNDKVQLQNLQLQELNATKDKFFSIISHDLKGPLNSLTSFASLLINHTESLSKDDIQMLAKDLDKSVKNLFALLENLLEWSRSQTGNIEFKPEDFDLSALLEENQELLKTQALSKKITIVYENKSAVRVNANRPSINTVVRNLISNAIKFTPENGTITLNLEHTSQEVAVSIADTGVGMSPDGIQKLFRIDTKHTTKGTANEKGTGLGLILCKDFIEKNGGRISVDSQENIGSVFRFTIPH